MTGRAVTKIGKIQHKKCYYLSLSNFFKRYNFLKKIIKLHFLIYNVTHKTTAQRVRVSDSDYADKEIKM